MPRKKSPEIVNLSTEELDGIKGRLESNTIKEEDKAVILLVLSTYSWLHRQLQSKKLGIQRLRNLFGFSTEKKSSLKKNNDESDADLSGLSDADIPDNDDQGGNVTPIKKPLRETQKKTMVD